MKSSRLEVKVHLSQSRARMERKLLQKRDQIFKQNDNRRFRKPRSVNFDGSRIIWNDKLQSDLSDALSA